MEEHDYCLDFIIPSGETGPTGPIVHAPKIFVSYHNATTAQNLTISSATIFPSNSNIYTITNESIQFTETGYFEFFISGRLKETTTANGATLKLRTRNTSGISNNLITVQLQQGARETYFSQIKIGQYGTLQTVMLVFEKNGNSDASIEAVTLQIQRLPFPYSK